MAEYGFETGRFESVEVQAQLVSEWQGNYHGLIGKLSHICTEVKRSRTLERDADIAPFTFVRAATHEFVYPPQETTLGREDTQLVDPTPAYALQAESIERSYDPTLVQRKIVVFYDDADSRISMRVTDEDTTTNGQPRLLPELPVLELL